MNEFQAKREAKRERLEMRAERLAREADASFGMARKIGDMIPLGQPVLVDHYSAKGHRRDIAKIDNAMRKGCDLQKAAQEAANRADSVGTGGISSDDPEAIAQLREKLAKCEELQETVKRVNALVRKGVKAHGADHDAVYAFLIANGISEKLAKGSSDPVQGVRGIPGYVTTNNGAEMRRIKSRISKLESIAKLETKEITVGTVRIVQNIEANRMQLFFPGKPDAETIKDLKSSGFRWAPSERAWQRHISNGASYEGKRIAREFAARAETQE